MLACSSPKLFAAYRVLLRLLLPRHPPCALSTFLYLSIPLYYLLFISHCPYFTINHSYKGTIKIKEEDYKLAKLFLLRKEVIHPHLPVRIPCYDFTPIAYHTFSASSLYRLGQQFQVQQTLVV